MTTDRVGVRSAHALQTVTTEIFAIGRLSNTALTTAPTMVSVIVAIANVQRDISVTTVLFHETVSSKSTKSHQHRRPPGDLQ